MTFLSSDNTVQTIHVDGVMQRILAHYRAMHAATNCHPNRLVKVERAPGHALAKLTFQHGAMIVHFR
jgi:hypothetical protein